MAISLKDLARLAGVSVSTVTRALQDKPDVNPSTRRRVLDLAEQHKYRPNILARSLVTSRTYTIGVIVPDLTNPFFPALIKGIESSLWQSGYSVILADTDFDAEKEGQTVEEFMARRVDALIISPIAADQHHEWIGALQSSGIPLVSLTRLSHHDADVVVAADRQGARKAVEHLLSIGRNKIVYLGNASSGWADGERIAGVREAFAEAGLPMRDWTLQKAPSAAMETGRTSAARILRDVKELNAIIAFDDYMAIGVRAAVVEAGLRIPEDIALVGFDNIELSALPDISLTTVDIPKLELGRVSARLAMERVEELAEHEAKFAGVAVGDGGTGRRGSTSGTVHRGERGVSPAKEIVLNTELIVRGSTGG